jgi:DNA modification methylase
VGDLPARAYSSIGDVWLCGQHRLACGDCTDPAIVAQAKGGLAPILMVTDPPYGVNYDPLWRIVLGPVASTGRVRNDDRADWREAWRLFGGDVAYVWHSHLLAAVVEASLVAADFALRSPIVWVKHKLVIGRSNYHWQHEACWYAVRKGGRGNWQGDRKQSTVWQIAHDKTRTVHSTQKPAEAMLRPILNNSRAGQVVYDPFLGSGTTMIACEMSGRRCIGLELDPGYVDVAVQRWQDFTGERASREADGKTLAALEQETITDEAGNQTDAAGAASPARQPAPARDADRRAGRARGSVAGA